MRRLISSLVVVLLATVVGVAAAAAKDSKPGHPRANPAHEELQGYCPVAFVVQGKAVKGNPKFTSVVDGHRYFFSSAKAKKMFDADPLKYQVAYGGSCATAMSMGREMKGDPRHFTVHAGRIFLFSSEKAKQMFDAMPDSLMHEADRRCEMPEKKE
jgi:YHS domain-containing protein